MKLVRRYSMRPMWHVLTRYNIGIKDKFDRGLWIGESDLIEIKKHMLNDESLIEHLLPDQILVNGSNQHNQVDFLQFVGLIYSVEFNGGAKSQTVLRNIAARLDQR